MTKYLTIITAFLLLGGCGQDIGKVELNSGQSISGYVYIDDDEKFVFTDVQADLKTGGFNLEMFIGQNQSILQTYSKKYPINNNNNFNIELPVGKHSIVIENNSTDGKWIFYSHNVVNIEAGAYKKLNIKLYRVSTVNHAKYLDSQSQLSELSKVVTKDDNRYINNGDGTVTDKTTQLMWKKCVEGLSGEQCRGGRVKKLKWQSAKQYASDAVFSKYADWRLPSYVELATLSYCSKGRKDIRLNNNGYLAVVNDKIQNGECKQESYQMPTINQNLFPNTPIKRIWTASELIDYHRFAFYIHFSTGSMYYDDINNSSRFRLVRNIITNPITQ